MIKFQKMELMDANTGSKFSLLLLLRKKSVKFKKELLLQLPVVLIILMAHITGMAQIIKLQIDMLKELHSLILLIIYTGLKKIKNQVVLDMGRGSQNMKQQMR